MKDIDNANDLLFEALTILSDFHNQELTFQQRKDITMVIENLEEVRSILYDLKNGDKSSLS